MPEFLRRIVARYFDYTTRHHLKARIRTFDYKFLAALVALAVAIVLVIKYY